jgi:amidohydrolase
MKNIFGHILPLIASLAFWALPLHSQKLALPQSELDSLVETYKNLHAHPELSHYEENTARFLANELRSYGYSVTERFGQYQGKDWKSYGVVAVMKNSAGPVILFRTDMDALPVEEKTGLAYASHAKMPNDAGSEVPVMHACGHDLHMTVFLAAARRLAQMKDRWQGTLILIGQPAEETGEGARALLAGGLYSQFPKPDYALALHDTPLLEAGKIGYCPGFALASATSADLIVRGIGSHGSRPEGAKDPIVVSAQIILALQTIVSREKSPLDPAVVTVGSIHGGTKHNIIPDEVHLQLTIRAYEEAVRQQILASIDRIARHTALAAGIPEERAPILTVSETIHPTFNEPALMERLSGVLSKRLGDENVVRTPPIMGSEDFGEYSLPDHSVPGALFWLGVADPQQLAQSKITQIPPPYLHSAKFAPLPAPSIETGVAAMTAAVLELMTKPESSK